MDYNVIGYISGSFGLAVAGRNTVHALLATHRGVAIVDIDPGGGRFRVDDTYASFSATGGSGSRIDLFHMNPLELGAFRRQWTHRVDWTHNPNVCVPFWELPLVPESWIAPLEAMDAILAPTHFIQTACEAATSTPTLHYPQAVFLPDDVKPDRSRWGIAENQTVFLLAFDPGSDIRRKNPWAAIEAFQFAFGDRTDVLLVVRVNSWSKDPSHVTAIERVELDVEERPNVRLVRDVLTYREVLSLYSSCDVVLSTHRSEGLGLPLMEAMSLGKVVIATGWSGNLDFMNDSNSRLLRYELVPVNATHSAYASEIGRPGQFWAEPDSADTVGALQQMAANPELRASLGKKAAADMEARRQMMLSGETFASLEALVRNPPTKHSGRSQKLRMTLRRYEVQRWINAIKRGIVLAGRAIRVLPPGD